MTLADRIEKRIVLRATRARVWRALTDAGEFGKWFRVKLEGPFEVGAPVKGHITHPGYEHLTMEVTVVQMDAERLFSYRWHPYAVDPTVDYSTEPTTLVEFRLEDAPDRSTALTITESGFERVPAGRRDEAFRMNDGGWTAQIENIRIHVES